MNRLPNLRDFLKGDDLEVEEYEGLEVQFVQGRKATLTVHRDGVFEKTMSLPDDKEQLRSLLQEVGFNKIANEERLQQKKEHRRKRDRDAAMKRHDDKVRRKNERDRLKREKERLEQQQRQTVGPSETMSGDGVGQQTTNSQQHGNDDQNGSDFSTTASRLEVLEMIESQNRRLNRAREDLENLNDERRMFIKEKLGIDEHDRDTLVNHGKVYSSESPTTMRGIPVPTVVIRDEL